jgi:asparagine synthase (glutamine-hydrolysing)
MCGIAGLVQLNNKKPSEKLVKSMIEAIYHRGPDDGGVEIIGKCGLGNRRLAIIDLSAAGHMPMWEATKEYCITFNGEIYNFNQLKRELVKKGYKFLSNSDTEVIVNLYKEYGERCVSRLRGMFAFAIWDRKKEVLFLARDHFGIKPLHYYINNEIFLFGSEIKSILLHPNIKKEVDTDALSHYFSVGFGAVGSPLTIFKNIYKLPPASYGILEKGKFRTEKYWGLENIRKQEISFEEAVEKTKELVEESVKEELISDVPLGTFLSGGIDSSLVSAFAQRHTKGNIKTFSIGFKDKAYDESEYAKQVADYLGTDHNHKSFDVAELIEVLPRVIEKLDEPLADASILPTYLLTEFTREKVTVALSGDGGDEIFAGYPTYIAHQFAQPFRLLSKEVLSGLKTGAFRGSGLISKLPILKHAGNLSTEYKIERFFDGIDRDLVKQYLQFMGPMNLLEKKKLLRNKNDSAYFYARNNWEAVKDWTRQKQLQYLDFKLFLEEDCLVKTDRASSFNSLEVRPPFLNVELTEFVYSLPSSHNFKKLKLKRLLKEVSVDILPSNIINRSKKGFGIPTGEWMRNELKEQLRDLLAINRIRKQGLFDEVFVDKLLTEHIEGKKNHRMVLWNLFIFQLWWDRWVH